MSVRSTSVTMINFSLIFVLSAAVAAGAVPYNKTQVGADCTIHSFNDVKSVVSKCKAIVVQGITVPAGKTLELDLQSDTSLTFEGTTTFEASHWDGPLIAIQGKGIKVSGASGSKLDGLGAKYWDGKGDSGVKKPKFFKIKSTEGSTFHNINLLNCPKQCVSISGAKNVHLSNWNIDVSAGDKNKLGHNTDGFDISDTDTLLIENSVIKNQDDCVAINSGKNLHFSKLTCSGGHGISFSIGQSKTDGSKNYAQNITFSDCSVVNSDNGIHVKTHVDAPSGYIKDVTYSNIKLSGIRKYAINVQQDYKGGHSTGKAENNISINGLNMKSITGSMASGEAVYILCGSHSCSNFKWSGISISGAHSSNSCNFKPTGFSC